MKKVHLNLSIELFLPGWLDYLRQGVVLPIFLICIFSQPLGAQDSDPKVHISDEYHYSIVFAANRNYRIFLPPSYTEQSEKHYPVIYFFHGWNQRYFGSMGEGYSDYDQGDDNNGDNIEKFVSENEVIVVKVDGLNQFSTDPLNLSPYNVSTVTTFRQFPFYFKELVQYIDAHYRTKSDRENRAVSGLSMGGFMTWWMAEKFPDFVGAAGVFCGSTEFSAGPLEFPIIYPHKEMYDNVKGVKVRFHNGTRDRLRFYHQDFNRYWLNLVPDYEFKVYEASHVTCGLGDMFHFILEAFNNPLPKPKKWDHIDVYPFFEVWDYKVESDRNQAGFTILEDVDKNGFKSSVRNFLPDGELLSNVTLNVITGAVYKPNQEYTISDTDLNSMDSRHYTLQSDSEGRLHIKVNGNIHHIGISSGEKEPNLCLSSFSIDNMDWATTGKEVRLSLQILNKGMLEAENIQGTILGISDGLEVSGTGNLQRLSPQEINALHGTFKVVNRKSGVDIAKFKLMLKDEAGRTWEQEFEIRFMEPVEELSHFVIADGKDMTVVKAAVDSVHGKVGAGNGDGLANPGESIVILVKEGGQFLRTYAYTNDPDVNVNRTNIRIADPWQEYDHIGGAFNYTVPLLSSDIPDNKEIWFYIEYWLPGKISGQHIIKKGKVKVSVKGKDRTPPQLEWDHVLNNDRLEARVYDGSGVDQVYVKFIPDHENSKRRHLNWETVPPEFKLELNDEGVNGDITKDDGIYSIKIENQPSYFYTVSYEFTDSNGNTGTKEKTEALFLKDTRIKK